MRMQIHRLSLPLAHTFTIARGSISEQGSLVVELIHDGLHGWGEVTENSYYGHTFESMTKSLSRVTSLLEQYATATPESLWDQAYEILEGDTFALSALDAAAHDWYGKKRGLPTWKVWGLNWQNIPASSYTIGIDSIERMVEKLREQPGWPLYKIKLGTEHDLEIVKRLREETEATFRVDANCGWTVNQAIENSNRLKELNVEFIEQPLPAEAPREAHAAVYHGSALPIIADESCQVAADVSRCAGLFHGINVKLCKCGGLTAAVRMLREARGLGLKTMVGCMVESSIGISTGAQLLPLLDYADLDGAVLLKEDPAIGVQVVRGQFSATNHPGHGGRLK